MTEETGFNMLMDLLLEIADNPTWGIWAAEPRDPHSRARYGRSDMPNGGVDDGWIKVLSGQEIHRALAEFTDHEPEPVTWVMEHSDPWAFHTFLVETGWIEEPDDYDWESEAQYLDALHDLEDNIEYDF